MDSPNFISPYPNTSPTRQESRSPVNSSDPPSQTQVASQTLLSTEPRGDRQRPSRTELRTPEPQTGAGGETFNSPGHIPNIDWEGFEKRYEAALADANDREQELLREFDGLVKYFNVWASAASAHDNERAVKRLQTRERFVRISEHKLAEKKQHLTEVVRAFRGALALLEDPLKHPAPNVSSNPNGNCANPPDQADLHAFHQKHLGSAALDQFSLDFLQPCDPSGQEDADDDGLGYYPDGVKRTLTDEQIEIFRHSEMESLRRQAEKANESTEDGELVESPNHAITGPAVIDGDAGAPKKNKNKKKKGNGRKGRPEVKPDLRKRTWDVVDTGLQSLDYGEETQTDTSAANPSKRRQISYDDF